MFKGSAIRVFRGTFDNGLPWRFFSILCFDWVGRENGAAIPELFLQEFEPFCQQSGSAQDIQWVFVLQHNPSPNHASFLTATNTFLNQTSHPFVRRHDAAVVMVSTASTQNPSRGGQYGYSSIIFGPRAPFDSKVCQPTFATQSSRLRSSDVLGTCKDVLFREMGECLHRVDVRVPNFVVADPTDRTAAVVRAETLPFSGPTDDPRIPSAPVPAVVKWTNDELDNIPDFQGVTFTDTAVLQQLRTSRIRMVRSYRTLPSQDLTNRISGGCSAHALSKSKGDPAEVLDTLWGDKERFSLQHIIQTLSFIDGALALDPQHAQLHARHEESGVEIAAICGATHADCQTAFARLAALTHSPILLVSRDDQNSPHLPREVEHFADPRQGAGVKLTDSQTLMGAARTKQNAEYGQYIRELLDVADRPII
jgi:hypothetical protein